MSLSCAGSTWWATGRESEAVEVVMLLDRSYWSNFLAGDLQGIEAGLERGSFGGGPRKV